MSSPRRKNPRTMYMHTLQGRPASYEADLRYIHFVGGRNIAKLVPTLKQLRREQQAAMEQSAREGGAALEWAHPKHYGYVMVRGNVE